MFMKLWFWSILSRAEHSLYTHRGAGLNALQEEEDEHQKQPTEAPSLLSSLLVHIHDDANSSTIICLKSSSPSGVV
jgi:hypothetical protein